MALTGGLMTGENAAQQGLGWAANTMQNATDYEYPAYVSSAAQSPTQMAYANYSANAPMQQITTPNYSLSANKQAWNSWNPQQANNYGAANTNAQAAPFQWNGMMGGDYDKLQMALTTPGQIAAQNAYNTGSANLNNAMSGKGLYGSSIMANSANEGINREYMNALAVNAANAAAQRYGMQQQDLNNQNSANLNYAQLQTGVNQGNVTNALQQQQALNALRSGDTQALNALTASQNTAQNAYAKDLYGLDISREQNQNAYNQQNAQMNMTQAANTYSAGAADAARQQAYNQNAQQYALQQAEQQRMWNNQQAYEPYQYNLSKNLYGNQQTEAKINQALALAGQGAPLSTAASNYQLQQQNMAAQAKAADDAINAQNTGGLLGVAGTGLGMLGYGWANKT